LKIAIKKKPFGWRLKTPFCGLLKRILGQEWIKFKSEA